MNTKPYWEFSGELPQFQSLSSDLEVDVAIIGGGLTGITTAHLLKEAGAKVALLDRQRCAEADTGHTTAHLTYVTDERLHHLVKVFGKDAAQAFWEAGVEGIDRIFEITQAKKIDCQFRWVPGYLHGALKEENKNDRESLEKDAELAREFGFDAEFVETVPYARRPGVRFANQAKFHPLKYLAPLLQAIPGEGCHVFENTEVTHVEPEPLTVHAGKFKVRCSYLVIATHTPLMGKTNLVSATLFQTKLALYTSYVLGATLPRGLVPEALYWDTTDPYYYLRVDQRSDHDRIIFGGEDVKTGQEEDAKQVFNRLEKQLALVLPQAQV